MSEFRRGRRLPLAGPLILIALGLLFLLNNFGLLTIDFLKLWPLILILIGLELILARGRPHAGRQRFDRDLGDLKGAHIEIEVGIGDLKVGHLTDPTKLVEGRFETGISPSFAVSDGEGRLRLARWGGEFVFLPPLWRILGDRRVKLTPQIPLTMSVDAWIGDVDLDLSSLKLTNLHVDSKIGESSVEFPQAAGLTTASLRSYVGDMTLDIPSGVAARIEVDLGFLASLRIDRGRFKRVGGFYVSDDFESAENRLDLRVTSFIGDVKIR